MVFVGYWMILVIDRLLVPACKGSDPHDDEHSKDESCEKTTTKDKVEGEEKQEETPATKETVSKTTALVLVFALGAHAFFEGIAFGLLTSIELAG